MRVFNCFAVTNHSSALVATFRQYEGKKHCPYEERVHEVEHGNFTPLVFSSSGGMGMAATTMYKPLAHLLSAKQIPLVLW